MSLTFLFTACTDEHYYEGGNAEIETYFKEVLAEQWRWSDNNARYEVSFNMSEINQDIIDYEAVIPYLFDEENGIEVVRALPYEKEYELENGYIFTERISYHISKGKITFFIEVSDLVNDPYSPRNCEFKIVVVKALL